jgi:ribonuclease HII
MSEATLVESIESNPRFLEDVKWREHFGVQFLAGVDEAGRGPLAGPVTAAAVILDPTTDIAELRDSKKLSEKKRDALAPKVRELALAYAVVHVSAQEIDEINILQASLVAMERCLEQLSLKAEAVLVDGNKKMPHYQGLQLPLVKGDDKSLCIAAASILAKTERDAYMYKLDAKYPEYGFAKHKGYPTKVHMQTVEEQGLCPEHRLSFGPCKGRSITKK